MTQPPRLHLFQAFGVELEYMIVDRETLDVKPIADELLKAELGEYGSDFENGIVTWSNELVVHVIEMKSTRPESNFPELSRAFAENVTRINSILDRWNAMLLPTASHPWMNPDSETTLWPHDNNEVYAAYNRIFNCRGHGWSNCQATHLNLPFYDDEEFTKLHAAIRVVLPLLPALCASSPILDGKPTGFLDTRLCFYKTNQQAIPSITGLVIPEAVFSRRQYFNHVYDRIRADVEPHDPDNILDPIWVNSRGAIPRFDRGSIEIRVMDVQECPAADLAIQTLVIETIRALASEKFAPLEKQMEQRTEDLAKLLDDTVQRGGDPTIGLDDYAALFGVAGTNSVRDAWKAIYKSLGGPRNEALNPWHKEIGIILEQGPLAARMLRVLDGRTDKPAMDALYRTLADCLRDNRVLHLQV
jgi:carboxylate-amine ligase